MLLARPKLVCKALGTAVAIVVLCVSCTVPPTRTKALSAIDPVRRVALVIGNGAYQSVQKLQNPTADARAVADVLRTLGFQTDLLLDADRAALLSGVQKLSRDAAGADAAVLFYAGHALDAGGQNVLLPVSISVRARADLQSEAVSLDDVLASLDGKAARTVILLDSCRDNPFVETAAVSVGHQATAKQQAPPGVAEAGTRSVAGGLAGVSSSAGTLIAFATAPGRVALDGDGEHSPFTSALLKHIAAPNVDVRQMLGYVRRDVRTSTQGRQVPWDNSSLEGSLYLNQTIASGSMARGPSAYDGVWHGDGPLWKLSLTITNGFVSGRIESCRRVNKDNAWSAPGPTFEGTLDQESMVKALTAGFQSWRTRQVLGKLPELQVSSLNKEPGLDCPDGSLTMQRQ